LEEIMDVAEILKGAGAELPPEVLSKVEESIKVAGAAEIESATLGLKTNNAELLDEKRKAKESAEKAKDLADKAEVEKLKASGETEKLREFYDKQHSEQLTKLQDANAQLLKANSDRDLANSRAKFGGKFLHSTDADLYLEKMVKIGEDGNATYQDLKGNVVATDSEAFGEWLGSQDSLKHVLKAPASNGGGGNGGGEGVKPIDPSTETTEQFINRRNSERASSH
jgi:hypothetical protein